MVASSNHVLINKNNALQYGLGGGRVLDKHILSAMDDTKLYTIVSNVNTFMQIHCVTPQQQLQEICQESKKSECIGYNELMGRFNKQYDIYVGSDSVAGRIANERCDLYLSFDRASSDDWELFDPTRGGGDCDYGNEYGVGGCVASYGGVNGTSADAKKYIKRGLSSPIRKKVESCRSYVSTTDAILQAAVNMQIAHEKNEYYFRYNKNPPSIDAKAKDAELAKLNERWKALKGGLYSFNSPDLMNGADAQDSVDGVNKLIAPPKYDFMTQRPTGGMCANAIAPTGIIASTVQYYGDALAAKMSGMSVDRYLSNYQNALLSYSAHNHNIHTLLSYSSHDHNHNVGTYNRMKELGQCGDYNLRGTSQWNKYLISACDEQISKSQNAANAAKKVIDAYDNQSSVYSPALALFGGIVIASIGLFAAFRTLCAVAARVPIDKIMNHLSVRGLKSIEEMKDNLDTMRVDIENSQREQMQEIRRTFCDKFSHPYDSDTSALEDCVAEPMSSHNSAHCK